MQSAGITLVKVGLGMTTGAVLFLLLALACGATVGGPADGGSVAAIGVGMTLGMAVTWNVVIAAEMIAGDNGLGRLTWEGYVSNTSTVVILGMISIGLAGYLSTTLVDYAENKMMPWRKK